ncbi:hypothetical protein CPAR01_05652, partial [Colletotrichum paranaense]
HASFENANAFPILQSGSVHSSGLLFVSGLADCRCADWLPAARPGQVLPGRALIGPGFFFSPSSSDHQLNTLKLTPVPTSWIRSRVKGAKPCPISGYLGQTRHRLQGPPRPLLLARLLLNRTEPLDWAV